MNVDVVTMPDFFLDHSVEYPHDANSLAKRLITVAATGGGEIPDVPQQLDIGGNAAICSLALSRLGANVHLVMKTNRLGMLLLQYFCDDFDLDLSHVRTNGDFSPTIILEMGHGKRVANVMFGESRGASDLGFEDLQGEDLDLLSSAHFVCVFNWLYNRKGTELAEGVFKYCKENSSALTFFDPADPWPRRRELPDLLKKILRKDLLDHLALNGNEAMLFARILCKTRKAHGRNLSGALEAGRTISERTPTKVYVHTTECSASFNNGRSSIAPCFDVRVARGTGAGDSWNAGILIAERMGLEEDEKLLFANAIAARYISRPDRTYATMSDMVKFLREPRHTLKHLPQPLKS